VGASQTPHTGLQPPACTPTHVRTRRNTHAHAHSPIHCQCVSASSMHTCTGAGRVKPTLAMLYTCGKCNTRSAKTFSHQAYRHGVVLVRNRGLMSPRMRVHHVDLSRAVELQPLVNACMRGLTLVIDYFLAPVSGATPGILSFLSGHASNKQAVHALIG